MLLSFTLVVLSFWVLLHLDRRRSWPGSFQLPPPKPQNVSIAAIVPARNEAELLPKTLPTLLDQELPDWSVVLVDDRSQDGSAELAEALGSGHQTRLIVERRAELNEGWVGKVGAMQAGVARLRQEPAGVPEWILFTDADISHRPGSVASLLARAETEDAQVVSVMARLDASGFWARLLVPPFIWFFQLLYPFRLVARPGSKVAAAAGGCLLVKSAALESAGGLQVIRAATIDDVSLAKALKGAGAKLWLGFDDGIVSLRPYGSLAPLWQMVARSAFIQLRCSLLLLLGTLMGLLVFFVSPPFLLVASLLQGEQGLLSAAAASAILLLQFLALAPAARQQRVPLRYAALLPLSSGLYGLMTLASAWRHLSGRGNPWKREDPVT